MSNRKKRAVVGLAELYRRALSEGAVDFYAAALVELTDEQVEQAAHLAARRFKFMPTPAELIECCKSHGVSYEAQALLAWENLEAALDANTPSVMSGPVAAICRSLGGFQHLRELPLTQFATWKRKEFLEAYTALAKDSPERLAALAGPGSAIGAAALGKPIPTREQTAQLELENRQKLLDLRD